MTRYFTHYWTNSTWRRESRRKWKWLDHTASNLFRKQGVSRYDAVYVVTVQPATSMLDELAPPNECRICEPEGYHISGLSPSQAGQLLEALERAGIVASSELIEEPTSVELEGDSGETEIIITVDAASEDAARRIEAALFGNEL